MAATPLSLPLGDQVRLRFIGWPDKVKKWEMVDGRWQTVVGSHPREGKPLILHWNSRPYVVHAGQDIHIPFELAKKEFGDPRSLDKPQKYKPVYGEEEIIPDRPFEVNRLRGYYQNSIIEFREYIPSERWEGPLSDVAPIVEIYSMTGERIMMVTDDPNGDTVVVQNQTRSEANTLQETVQFQADTIMELKKTNELLLQKLNIRREDLEALDVPPSPPPYRTGSPEAPDNAQPIAPEQKMVYNPRTARVSVAEQLAARIQHPNQDPTNINEIPADVD